MSEGVLTRESDSESVPSTAEPMHPRLRLVTVLAFLGFFLFGAAWAAETPWDGAPDEAAHMVRAVGVVTGQIVPDLSTGALGTGADQRVPSDLKRDNCFAFHPDISAICLAPPAETGKTISDSTAAGRYQPLYYAVVGWPLSWWPNETGLLVARLLSVAMSAAFLALAVRAIVGWIRRPLMLGGLLVAATPMFFSIAGVINPNGLEIAASIAMWTAMIPLVLNDGPIDRRLLILAGLSAAVVACVRPSGPMFVLLAGVVLLAGAGRGRLLRLARQRGVWVLVGVIGVAGIASGIWILVMKANELGGIGGRDLSLLDAARVVLIERVPVYLRAMIGVFGYLDTYLPDTFYYTWAAVAGFLALTALVVGLRGDRWRLALVTVAAFAVPMISDTVGAPTLGMIVQGRYILPAAVGIALLAAYVISERGLFTPKQARSAVGWLATITLPLQLWGLSFAMIRFQHGLNAPLPLVNPLDGPWHPQAGSITVLVLAVGGLGALAAVTRTAHFTKQSIDRNQLTGN